MTSLFLPQSVQFNTASQIGQYSLKRTESALATNIRNLSTGLQLHSGRDDPGAFVTSSILSSEIAYMGHAVSNCKAADSICAVADSALAQINDILIDIRAMVSNAANTGAMSDAELMALQLQVDASLDTIDRIANSTQFIDQKLLDGSLDFTTYGLDDSKVNFLQVNQANFMGQNEKDIAVKILQQAKQAALYYRQVSVPENVSLSVGGNLGYTTIPVSKGAELQAIVDAVNLVSDSTGVEAKIETRATNGSITLSSVGDDNDLILTASEAGTLGGNFVVKYTAPREGNDTLQLNYTPGQGNEPNCIEIVLQTNASVGNQPPEVLTTAAQIVELINTSDDLRDDKGNGMVVASLPNCTNGAGTVTAFEYYACYGTVEQGNALQFLAPANSPDITFVSEPGQSLGIAYSKEPTYAKAEAVVQGLDPGTSFSLKTANSTADYDGYEIKFVDSPNESVELDETKGTVVFNIDFTGRSTDVNREPINMLELQAMFEASEAGNVFSFVPHSVYNANNAPRLSSNDYLGINATMATVSGGLVDPGTLTVQLETDQNGLIKTTANDLIDYFNNPATPEEAALLKQLGISVSSVCESTGNGLLGPTAIDDCDNGAIQFCSMGLDNGVFAVDTFPSTTIISNGGIDAVISVTARKYDSELNGCNVLVVSDPNGPSVSYDAGSNQLAIGIDTNNPSTAQEIIELINSDTTLSKLFVASLPQSVPGSLTTSNGTGFLQLGDSGTMTIESPNNPTGAPMLCASDNTSVGIVFYSTDYGSNAFVDVQATLSGQSFPVVDRFGIVTERTTGIDISASINGQLAIGNGLTASMNTTELDMSITIDASVRSGDLIGFRITGGGALMQLGADVDPTQQVRMAFQSVYVTNIGGPSGNLSQLRFGNDCDLLTNTKGAYRIVEESIQQIATFRSRLGSFQKYEVSRNLSQLEDLIAVASAANSEIRDTDFAAESTSLGKNEVMFEAIATIIKKPSDNMRLLTQLLNR